SNAIVAAIDHGLYNGPRPGFEDLSAVVGRLAGADAILISPGMAPHVASVFSKRGAPAMIVRLNWGTQYATQWNYRESRSLPMDARPGSGARREEAPARGGCAAARRDGRWRRGARRRLRAEPRGRAKPGAVHGRAARGGQAGRGSRAGRRGARPAVATGP